MAEKAGMCSDRLRYALKKVLSGLDVIEKTFGIKIGPKAYMEKKHENFINNFLLSYIEGESRLFLIL
jgi:hypothetical protein